MCSSENHPFLSPSLPLSLSLPLPHSHLCCFLAFFSLWGRKSVFAMVTRFASFWHTDRWVHTSDNISISKAWYAQRGKGQITQRADLFHFRSSMWFVLWEPHHPDVRLLSPVKPSWANTEIHKQFIYIQKLSFLVLHFNRGCASKGMTQKCVTGGVLSFIKMDFRLDSISAVFHPPGSYWNLLSVNEQDFFLVWRDGESKGWLNNWISIMAFATCLWNDTWTCLLLQVLLWPQAENRRGHPTAMRESSPQPLAWKRVVLPKAIILPFSTPVDGH